MSEKNNQPIYRSIHPEVKVIDAAKGIVDYVASDESVDAHNEVILAKGWKFSRFRKNAPFLNSHNSWDIGDQLGKVVSAEVKDGQLIERVQWAVDVEENALAQLGFRMTEAGYLKAVSVGFWATKSAWRGDGDDWKSAVSAAGLSAADASMVRRIFIEQEQIELSAVVIGANANALAKAFEDGAVSEEQMHKVGFGGDDEFDFLMKAAKAIESPECDAAFEAMLSLQMNKIYQGRPGGREKNFQEPRTPEPDSEAKTRAAAEEVQRRAEKEGKFLDQLDRLTK